MKKSIGIILLALIAGVTFAQKTTIEGYVFEVNNRGYIGNAKVAILDAEIESIQVETVTNEEGFFTAQIPSSIKEYIVVANHRDFLASEVNVKVKPDETKSYAKVEMERKPGYIFDVTVAENRPEHINVDAITGYRIDIYNNTTKTEELVLEDHPHPTFQFNFLPGNYYTIMLRKKGYLAKRIEAYVDIDGCILCFDGLGKVEPNVTDVMSQGNEIGTFLANVELDPIEIEKTFKIDNIYYDFDKSYIRPDAAIELDKVVQLLEDNPAITVELGSHTDSRGRDGYNMSLSDRRAASAVEYIINNGGIDQERITSKGYGESQLANRCSNGVKCSEEEHQFNRRTELKITGIEVEKETIFVPLKRIIEEDALLEEVLNSEIIEIKSGEEIPEVIQKQLKEGGQ